MVGSPKSAETQRICRTAAKRRFAMQVVVVCAVFLLLSTVKSISGESANGTMASPAAPLRAFPGAEGFGADTPGGRGGDVRFVTNLEDNDERSPVVAGSLREAIEAKGPRIVLFSVSGTIHLKQCLTINESYITIAGQSAPGDGICLADNKTLVIAHDVVIRHLRFRHGDTSGDKGDTLAFRDSQNVIVDHCSISWSERENLSFSRSTTKATLQWCIISEALHPKHGYGCLVAPNADSEISFHHNLFADNLGRNPRAASRGNVHFLFDYRNNIEFNWGTGWDWGAWAVYRDSEHVDINFIGNLSIAGLGTVVNRWKGISQRFELTTAGYRETALSSNRDTSRIYQRDNKIDSNVNGRLDPVDTGWAMIHGTYTKVESEFFIAPQFTIQTDPVDQVYERVLNGVGALPWHRDAADKRVIEGVRNQTGRIIKSQNEVGGWPLLESVAAPLDSDGDGIPDTWEIAHGLNPKDATDARKIAADGSGYANIEVYLNSLEEK